MIAHPLACAVTIQLSVFRARQCATQFLALKVPHDHSIDWLELNHRGTHLLFRDSKCQLHIYSLATGERKQLLQFVSYVQWVPDSDVIVVRIPAGTANSRMLVKDSMFDLVMGTYSFESVSTSH